MCLIDGGNLNSIKEKMFAGEIEKLTIFFLRMFYFSLLILVHLLVLAKQLVFKKKYISGGNEAHDSYTWLICACLLTRCINGF